LQGNRLRKAIRAHEFVANGYQDRFESSLGTVFSSSNYHPNSTAAFLVVSDSIRRIGLEPVELCFEQQIFQDVDTVPRASTLRFVIPMPKTAAISSFQKPRRTVPVHILHRNPLTLRSMLWLLPKESTDFAHQMGSMLFS
jgi:hypothetical protein